jgi:hypothetical protein
MLHLIYIAAFTVLAFLAVGNLIRNLMTLGSESQRFYGSFNGMSSKSSLDSAPDSMRRVVSHHPELLDDSGNIVREPYLVMRSMTVEDARDQLDAIYNASPASSDEDQGDF